MLSTGSSDVYVTGYKTRSELMPDGLTYFDGEDPSDDDEDEDDEDDEQPPQAIPLGSKRRAALMAVSLVCLSLASHERSKCLRRCSEACWKCGCAMCCHPRQRLL